MKMYTLLLVDDDPFILEGIGEDLKHNGYQVTCADSGDEAVSLLEKNTYDLVITDLVMARTDGIQVLKKTKDTNSETVVIILTGYGDMVSAIDALRNHADDYLLKPCESAEITYRINRCLKLAELSRQIKIYQKILPMCCVCKKIRVRKNSTSNHDKWISIEKFIHNKIHTDITSSYCPDCAKQTIDDFSKNR
jgi:DNA-binding response OmpR family regulator